MFRLDTTSPTATKPIALDWTISDFLAWIAAEDARCHDEALRPVLTAVESALASATSAGARPRSPVALVRAVGARVRETPALRETTLGGLAGHAFIVEQATAHAPTRSAAGPAPAAVPAPRLRSR